MEKGLLLHPKKGVNPYMTFCRRCGGESSELMLVGARDWIGHCAGCDLTLIGGGPCPRCGRATKKVRNMEEGERLPSTGPCDACKKEIEAHRAEVAKGGVYWRCADCAREGVIKASAPFAADVRKAHGIDAPAPCGVEFTKAECPACNPA
jgi:hypothetical protein